MSHAIPLPVVIITGAASGIGWATARHMAARGWRIAILDLDAGQAEQRAAELGPGHLGLACDVANADSVQTAVAAVVTRAGRIDALVNNAGIGDQTVPTLQQSIDAFNRLLSIHLGGVFLMSQAVIGQMLRQDTDARGQRGAIVNIGSIVSFDGFPGRNAYSAAKAGVLGMTRTMAVEWGAQGIRVNAVAPGYVATALTRELESKGAIDMRAIERRTPLGRMGDADEIAAAIHFLASPASSFITGAALPVDGGWGVKGTPDSL